MRKGEILLKYNIKFLTGIMAATKATTKAAVMTALAKATGLSIPMLYKYSAAKKEDKLTLQQKHQKRIAGFFKVSFEEIVA